MASTPKIFLLPCECSAELEIVAGQAGGTASCPACRRQVDVPKLREFSGLRLKSVDAAAAGGRWGPRQAWALCGLAVALLAWGGAAVVGAVPKAAISADQIRAGVQAEDDVLLYEALQQLANSSVARMPIQEELELKRRFHSASGLFRGLITLGGLGAAVAAVAGLALLASPKRP